MNLEYIRNLIENRIEKLKKPYIKDERLKFCMDNFSKKNVYSIDEIDVSKLEEIFSAIQISNSNQKLDIIKERSKHMVNLLNTVSTIGKIRKKLDILTMNLVGFLLETEEQSKDNYKIYIEYLKERRILSSAAILSNIKIINLESLTHLQTFKNNYYEAERKKELDTVLNFLEEDRESIFDILNFYDNYIDYIKTRSSYDYQYLMNIKSFRKKIEKDEKDSILIHIYNKIPAYIRKGEEEEKKYNKSTGIEIVNLQKGYNKLIRETEREEIKDIDDILDCFKEQEIKKAVLYYIYEHNNIYHNGLIQEYKKQ